MKRLVYLAVLLTLTTMTSFAKKSPRCDRSPFYAGAFRRDRYGATRSSACAGAIIAMPPGEGPPFGTMARMNFE